jgi:light-regulated signal transduction histidine kinase (bacteriophytochrome)
MEKLIEDMLAYSKLGRNLPPAHPVDVNDIVKTIEFEMRDKLSAEGQKIVVAQKLPLLHGVHSSMIYHVFQNLITNGLKFNKAHTPTVTIDVQDADSNYVFSVSDNGIGIPMEYKNKLFQMFKRLHTDSEFQGTGIGLAICKKIINFYNGEICFESQNGKGTTFYFSIPK